MLRLQNKQIIILTGVGTFFFGFGAPAMLNFYLLAVNSPLVLNLRGSLTFISSILGDGILLPIVNMFAASFLLNNKELVSRLTIIVGFISGLLITIDFHMVQGLKGFVNWSMPIPWQWNFLGFWHGVYMFTVSSFLSLFYIILIIAFQKKKRPTKQAFLVSAGLILFFILLKLDY